MNIAEDLATLRSALDQRLVTQRELASLSGVSQSQISRILQGDFKRQSRNVARLCICASAFVSGVEPDKPLPPMLEVALRSAWDGSHAGAHALIQLLEAAASLVNSGHGTRS